MKHLIRLIFISILTVALSGCMGGLGGGRPSPQQENALGAQQEQQILSKVRTIRSGRAYQALGRVVSRIAAVTGRQDFQWRYHLVDNPKVANAFVLPGGKVFVFSGLFRYIGNEDELAVVVGHEVTHALRSHGVIGAQRAQKAGLIGALLNIGMAVAKVNPNTAQTVNRVYQTGVTLGYLRPFSRKQEYEADSVGLMLMAKAGYDPRAALSFWQKFSRVAGRVPEYLATHPSPGHRIANIKALMPKALALYNQSPYRKRYAKRRVPTRRWRRR